MKSLLEELSVGSIVQNIEFYLLLANLIYINYCLVRAGSYKKPKASIVSVIRIAFKAVVVSFFPG